MDKQVLKEEQPVVYRILSNALKEDKLSHAYLFTGPREASKKEFAILMAQSLNCQHRDEDGFACGECDSCKRIENDQSVDLYWIRPSTPRLQHYTKKQIHEYFEGTLVQESKPRTSIGKDEIQQLQEQFASSAHESDYQVFILEEYEKATREASNSFLKFLEEPKERVLGILISERPELILETIRSRCQGLLFRSPSLKTRKEEFEYIFEGANEDPRWIDFFMYFGYDPEQAVKILKDNKSKEVLEAAEEYSGALDDLNMVFDLQRGVLSRDNLVNDRDRVRLFLQKLLFEVKKDHISPILKADVISTILDHIEGLARPYDLLLDLDQLYYQLFELSRSD